MSIPNAEDIFEYLECYNLSCIEQKSSETFTVDDATELITVSGSINYSTGDMVKMSTSDTLPTPFQVDTIYYLISVSDTTFMVASSYNNAIDEIAIDITDTGTGTHNLLKQDYKYMSSNWINDRINKFVIPFIERIIRLKLTAVTEYEEYYSGNVKDILVLNRKPVNELKAISYLNYALGVWVEGRIVAYTLESVSGTVRITGQVFPKGKNNIRVKYTAGFDEVPDILCQAIILLTCELVLGQIASRTGGGSIGLQSWNKNYGERGKYTSMRDDLKRQAFSIINQYKTGVIQN